MITVFIAMSAVLLNFCAGFAAAKIISLPKKSGTPQKCENETLTAKHIAEYRNFLNYDGTEQEEIDCP